MVVQRHARHRPGRQKLAVAGRAGDEREALVSVSHRPSVCAARSKARSEADAVRRLRCRSVVAVGADDSCPPEVGVRRRRYRTTHRSGPRRGGAGWRRGTTPGSPAERPRCSHAVPGRAGAAPRAVAGSIRWPMVRVAAATADRPARRQGAQLAIDPRLCMTWRGPATGRQAAELPAVFHMAGRGPRPAVAPAAAVCRAG